MYMVIVRIILMVRVSSVSEFRILFSMTVKLKKSDMNKGFGKGSCLRIRFLYKVLGLWFIVRI